jgi:hypothetical protein
VCDDDPAHEHLVRPPDEVLANGALERGERAPHQRHTRLPLDHAHRSELVGVPAGEVRGDIGLALVQDADAEGSRTIDCPVGRVRAVHAHEQHRGIEREGRDGACRHPVVDAVAARRDDGHARREAADHVAEHLRLDGGRHGFFGAHA